MMSTKDFIKVLQWAVVWETCGIWSASQDKHMIAVKMSKQIIVMIMVK